MLLDVQTNRKTTIRIVAREHPDMLGTPLFSIERYINIAAVWRIERYTTDLAAAVSIAREYLDN